MIDLYQHIRPYNDDEVRDKVRLLLADKQFIQSISRYKFPRLSLYFPKITNFSVRRGLVRQFSKVSTVDQLQQQAKAWLDHIVNNTIDQFSVSGMEYLNPGQAYLFISNHRDIAMDPALINYALVNHGFATSEIGIGDNLIARPYVEKLMRLNKSFIVRRSASSRREKFNALTELSKYIRHSINSGKTMWLAQREGRAKDGDDQTENAVLKMLHISGKKEQQSLSQSLTSLCIVPVCISYEWDPCDQMKAIELATIAENGNYNKSENEDYASIVTGIQGYKGHVHIAFSKPVALTTNDANEWSEAIDQAIHGSYQIYVNNKKAAQLLDDVENLSRSIKGSIFDSRCQSLNERQIRILLEAYAKPLRHSVAIQSGSLNANALHSP